MRWMVYPVVFVAFGLTAFAGVALKHSGAQQQEPRMMAQVAHHDVSGAQAGSVVIYKTTPDVVAPDVRRVMEPFVQDGMSGCRIGICQDV